MGADVEVKVTREYSFVRRKQIYHCSEECVGLNIYNPSERRRSAGRSSRRGVVRSLVARERSHGIRVCSHGSQAI